MAKTKKSPLDVELAKAKKTGKYMVAIWTIEDGKINLFRQTETYPIKDIQAALEMLKKNLEPISIKAARPGSKNPSPR